VTKGEATNGDVQTGPRDSNAWIDDVLQSYLEAHAESIQPKLEEFEKAAKVEGPNQRFRDLLTRAIVGCVYQHRTIRLERASQVNSDLLQLAKNAEATEIARRKLSASWKKLNGTSKAAILEYLEVNDAAAIRALGADADTFTRLAATAKFFAQAKRDQGGPTEMHPFRALIAGLARAFEAGRGRKASVTRKSIDDSYRGDFMQLVSVVEPLAAGMAEFVGREHLPLKWPCKASQGKYVESVLRALRSKDATPSRKRQPK
jgi:hypothetical protein